MEGNLQEDTGTKLTDMDTKKTLLVIPYLREGAQGGELETAVNGWIKNFKGNLKIVVVGDDTPITRKLQMEGKISVAVLHRRPENASEPSLDIVCKMVWVMSHFANSFKGCIWSNDDIYPVNPVAMKDIKALKGVGKDLTGKDGSSNYFQRAMARTRRLLLEAGKPIYNYSSHCPKWFDFERLQEVLDKFNCYKTPLLIESLYFNYWYTHPKAVRINVNAPGNRFKCGIYEANYDLAKLTEEMKRGVLFVNNSSVGYRKELILTIREFIKNS